MTDKNTKMVEISEAVKRAHADVDTLLGAIRRRAYDDQGTRAWALKAEIDNISDMFLAALKAVEEHEKNVQYLQATIAEAAVCILRNPYNAISCTLWLEEKKLGPTLYEHLVGELDIELEASHEKDIEILEAHVRSLRENCLATKS